MSRTPLFAAAKKALALSFRETGIVLPQKSALTRRRLLRLSAAAAGAAALSPALSWTARAQKEPPSVGIVGGGVAGLTAACRRRAQHARHRGRRGRSTFPSPLAESRMAARDSFSSPR